MPNIIDMKGQRFGRLTVIEYAGLNYRKSATWLCQCDCGSQRIIDGNSLRQGNTKSCGCLHKEMNVLHPNRKTHGMSGTRLYGIWKSMKTRCNNSNDKYYYCYGKKGIKICEEWNDFKTFYYWAIHNGYEENLTIERLDNDKDYSPDNCTWITIQEQSKHTSSNRNITIDGETHILSDWCKIKNIPYYVVWKHEKKGENLIDILTGKIPYKPRKRKKVITREES